MIPCCGGGCEEEQQCGGLEGKPQSTDGFFLTTDNTTGLLDYNTNNYDVYRYLEGDGTFTYHGILKGCVCEDPALYGEYCNKFDASKVAAAWRTACFSMAGHAAFVAVVSTALLFLHTADL